jgi:YDG domain
MKKVYLNSLKFWFKYLKFTSMFVLLLSTIQGGFGQTTLAVGDISIVGYNLNAPDNFAFVTWVNISDNTYIKFTDNGFLAASSANATNNGRGGENFVIWRNNTGVDILAGTVITIQDNTTASVTNIGTIVSGNLNGLSAAGDNIFAYQGAATTGANPDWSTNANPTTFNGTILFGLYTQGSSSITNWLTTGIANSNSSYLPSQLNVLNGNIVLASSASRGQYTGLRNNQTTLTNYKALVNNPSNWTTGSGAGTITLNTTAFTITSNTPAITTTGTLSAVNTTYGTASTTPTTFTVSGSNLTNDILITPPSGFEISKTVGGASGYAATQTLTQAIGSVLSTTIYVRLKAEASVLGSPYAGNIVLSSTGATSVNVATVSSAVTAKGLTISGVTANNKVFDGTTTATLSGTATLNGIVGTDDVSLSGTPTATFAQSAIGTGISVTVTGYSLTGTASGNYSVTQPTGLTADITSAPSPAVTSSLTASATYGVASTSYFITASNSPTSFNATGLPTGLTINTSTGEISGTPTDVAGSPFSVTISATNLGGTGTATLIYTINPKALTISFPSVPNKVYDKTNAATITGTLTGIVVPDVVTLNGTGTFSQVTVGSGLGVTSTATLGGADAAKYTLTQPTGLTANIIPLALTVTTPVAQNKVFDGNTNATITGTLSGVISPDAVTFLGTGTFASSAVGNAIAVTSTSTLGGADAGNYTLTQPSGLTANITASQFTEGNIAVFVAAASSTNTTASIVELNPNNSNQSGVLFPIPSSGTNLLRFSGSATSTGYLANSNDGSLLLFNGANNSNTTVNVNTLNPRGVGTFTANGTFNLPTTYTGSSGNQTRSSTSLDNNTFFIADQGGIYTNGSTSASPSGNLRGIKSFGGTVYVSQSSSTVTAIQINTIAAPSGSTIVGLPGLINNSSLQDFHLISSGTNGTSFDILYTISGNSATVGTIAKYSLVSGSWVANGTHTTAFGGFGLASKKAGTGAELFVSTGTGATTANSVIKLIDVAGYNTAINITTANNVTLYTAPTGSIVKGVAFAPITPPATVNLAVSSNTGTESGTTVITVSAVSTSPVSGAKTFSLSVSGTNITAGDYTLSDATITIPDGATTGSVTFIIVDDNIAETTETAILTLSNPSSGAVLGSLITQNIAITDNDNTLPTIAMDVATTSNFIDGGITTSPTNSFATSGVINDPTDPVNNFGIDFTIGDAETPVGSLTVTATSSNLTVLPAANITLTGNGASRNLKITPNAEGFSNVTVTVNDGVATSSFIVNYASSVASMNVSTTRFHTGTADASTAQMIDNDLMIVADDENQALRMYDRNNSGLPINSFDFTTSLGLTDISGGNPREVDIEASAKVGNRIYWMGSHSNSSSGGNRPNRSRFFATDIAGTGNASTLSYIGRYDNLKTDLLAWDASNGHGLGANFLGLTASAATGIAPEIADGSGFNIEGFEIAPNNTTAYICFRAPLQTTTTRTKALIIPLTNFTNLVSGNPTSTTATFGTPIQMDLGGRAIREMKRNTSGEYLIMAGPNDGATGIAPKDFRFYTWTGNPADAPILRNANLTALNSNGSFESIVDLPSPLLANSNLQVLVDNGDAVFYRNGVIAKELPQNNHKKFRSEFISLGTEILPLGTIKSIKTGDWEDVSTWDLGRIPQSGDLVIIDQNHEVTLNGNGFVKKIEYQGTGKLKLNSPTSILSIGL